MSRSTKKDLILSLFYCILKTFDRFTETSGALKIQLSLATGDGNLQEIFSWTDNDNPFGVRFMVFQHRQLASASNVANVKLRNLRNPDQAHTIIQHLNSPDLFCFYKTNHDDDI